MEDPVQEFVELKEKRLEYLICQGLLRHKDAYEILCRFTNTVRTQIKRMMK